VARYIHIKFNIIIPKNVNVEARVAEKQDRKTKKKKKRKKERGK
jgi:hypothetical protein